MDDAAHQAQGFLTGILIIFGSAVIAAWAFRILRAPSIIGFLVSGILIGPTGFGLIEHHDVEQLTELGLVLLLFTIGIELSPRPLFRMGKALLTATFAQLGIITALVLAASQGAGDGIGMGLGLLLGVMAALSSTAIVLKQLADRGETNSMTGMITTGILLLQDIVVIAIMVVLPLASSSAGGSWRDALGQALTGGAIVGGAVVAGRYLLPVFIERVIRPGGREFTALFAVLMACGGAWLTGFAGWSPALGACIAGLLLAESDVRHQVTADILPFRDVFNALFFCSLGMMVDIAAVEAHLVWIAVAVLATLPVKALITAGAVRLAGWPLRPALQVGIGLCTVSEFSYVLALEASRAGLLQADALAVIVVYAVGTMMVGATLVPVSGPIALYLSEWFRPSSTPLPEKASEPALNSHVIIVGFGVNGRNLAQVLTSTRIPHCIVEMSPNSLAAARNAGAKVVVGDAAQSIILDHAGIAHAHALVIAINDPQATQRIISQARAARPNLYILARTRYVGEVDTLYRLGASEVIPEDFETSIEISAHILKEMGLPDNIVEAQIAALRAGGYAMLRGKPTDRAAQEDLIRVLQSTATRNFYVTADSPVIGMSLAETNLRALSGVLVIAVVRNGTPTTNPPADFEIRQGDLLVMVGTHAQLDSAKGVLQPIAS